MSSPKRERRSRSKSPKRMPQLVSTRREYPDFHSSRGRGYQGSRPRRPFGGPRRPRGRTIYRAFSERYYPGHRRYDNSRRYSANYHRSRSRSRGRSKSYSRSRSRSHSPRGRRSHSKSPARGRRRGSRSSSSRSSSSRSGKHHKRHSLEDKRAKASDSKPVKLSHLGHEGSRSPEKDAPAKKKSRRARSASIEKRSPARSRGDGEDDRGSGRTSSHDAAESRSDHFRERGREGEQDGFRLERQRSKDTRPASPATSSKKGTGKGKQLIARNRLHNVFSMITHDEAFDLDEDISIAIQRNPYAEPSEESTVKKVFDEELFSMIRNVSEGLNPIFDREEIKAFGHDSNLADDPDFERRVIRLKPGKSSQDNEPAQSSSVQRFKSTHKITRMIERNSGRSKSRSQSRSRSKSPRRREPEIRLKMLPDPRYEARYTEMQKKEGFESRKLDPGDLRHELRGSSSKSPGDLRSRLEKRDETPWLSMKEDTRNVKTDSRRDSRDAPDYSRRKDKYQYAEWMDKPEMIPKNPSYYEHDNRDERDSRDRGRGRGFRGRFIYRRPFRPFRARGSFRGRGRGNYNDRRSPPPHTSHSRGRFEETKRSEGEWKHDKFAELEGDSKSHREDEQHPHSTSER